MHRAAPPQSTPAASRAPDGEPVIAVELLRLFCALSVMGIHYTLGFWYAPGPVPRSMLAGIRWHAPHQQTFAFGWLGVELFFVISGMMIARSAARSDGWTFARRRALRLLPAGWICACLTLGVVTMSGGLDRDLLAAWGRSIVLWPMGRQVDGSWWTLGIETAFYLAIAAMLTPRRRREAMTMLMVGIAGLSAAFWILIILLPAISPVADNRATQLLLLPHGCFFALGMAITDIRARGWTRGSQAAALLAFTAAALEITRHALIAEAMSGVPTPPVVAVTLFGLGTMLLAHGDRLQPWLRRIITPDRAHALGLMTYPLYLLHQDAGAAVTAALIRRGVTPGVGLLTAAGLAIVAARIVSRHAEPRLRDWLARRFNRLRVRAPDNPRIASPPAG